MNLLDGRQRVMPEFRRRITFSGITDIDQAVRGARQRVLVRLGRTNIHTAIDQSGIDADDVQVKRLNQPDGQPRLAGRCRTHEENHGWP